MSPTTMVNHNARPRGSLMGILVWIWLTPVLAGFNQGGTDDVRQLDPEKRLSQYIYDSWTMENGLPANEITAITQTTDGFLWLATPKGLVRFDGLNFKVFNTSNEPALMSNHVEVVHASRKGGLWIGCVGGGLLYYHQGGFQTWDVSDGLLDNDVTTLMEDRDGRLWIGTDGGKGVNLLENGKMKVFDLPISLKENNGEIVQAPDGSVWILGEQTLFQFKESAFKQFKLGPVDGALETLLIDQENHLWLAGTSGAFRFAIDQIPSLQNAVPKLEPFTRTIHMDRAGTVWLGTVDGLSRFYNEAMESYFPPKEGKLRVTCLQSDHEGNLWVGTYAKGLLRVKDGWITTLNPDDSEERFPTKCVYADRSGVIWIGGSRSGLIRYDQGRFTPVNRADGLPGNNIQTIAEESPGVFWLAGEKGLIRWAGDEMRVFDKAAGWNGDQVRQITVTRSGAVWLATFNNGVSLYRDGRFKSITHQDGLAGDDVRFVEEDENGNIWIGTTDGLSLYRNGLLETLTTRNGLPVDYLISFYQDRRGTIWLGTYGNGLIRYVEGQFALISTRHGLFDDTPWAIVEDEQGRLWMSCDRGVYMASLQDLNAVADGRKEKLESPSFGRKHGLKLLECNGWGRPSGIRAPDGKIWFTNMGGVVFFDPSRPSHNPVPPRVVIEEVTSGGVKQDLSKPIRLDQGSRDLTIRYTAISFRDPKAVRGLYQMEGYQDKWFETNWLSEDLIYGRLPPGSYRFHLKAANGDGVWNQEGASFQVAVPAQFHETSIFRYLVVLLAGALILIVFWIGRTTGKRVRNYLEALVNERTHELAARREELETLNHIVEAINRKTEFNEVVQTIIDHALQLFHNYNFSTFLLRTEADRPFRVVAAGGKGKSPFASDELKSEWVEAYIKGMDNLSPGVFFRGPRPNITPTFAPAGEIALSIPVDDVRLGFLFLGSPRHITILEEAEQLQLCRFREHAINAVMRAFAFTDLVAAQHNLVNAAQNAGMAEIAANVMHQMGNSLNSVNTTAQIIAEGESQNKNQLRFLGRCVKLLERLQVDTDSLKMKELVEAIRLVSAKLTRENDKLEQESMALLNHLESVLGILREQSRHAQNEPFLQPTDLNHIIVETVRNNAYLYKHKNIHIVRNLSDLPTFLTDQLKLKNILSHLLSNAYDAIIRNKSHEAGVIEITTSRRDQEIVLVVADNGIGIAKENMALIFTQGFSTKPQNSGFGLHYCANAVKKLKGQIQVDSRGEGKGAKVTITFSGQDLVLGNMYATRY